MSKSTAISVRYLRVFLASSAAVAGAITLLALLHYGHRSIDALAAGGHGQAVIRPDGITNATTGLTSFDVSGAGTVGLQGTAAVAIDAAGDVAGTYIDSTKLRHGFVRSASGTITTFDAPGAGTTSQTGQGTVVVSMDSAGDVAGYYSDTNEHHHGFLRTAGGTITTIDAPAANQNAYDAGTNITASNTAGVSTGFYIDASYLVHSFIRSASGSFTPFDAPDANQNYTGTQTYAINAGGDVTGSYLDKTTGMRHGFVRLANGTVTEFSATGTAVGTLPLSINTEGDITGVYTDSNGLDHGFVRLANGTFTSFDAPNAGQTRNGFTGLAASLSGTGGAHINDSGVVTGVYMDSSSVAHGFVRSAGGTINVIDAANAGTGAGGFMGTGGAAINASGVVAGTYLDANMVMHGFVLGGPAAVTVTPGSLTLTTTQNLSVTVAVTGGGATPTGTVMLASGNYTSAATALSGGSATISIPAGSLSPGQDTLTATYTPDAASSSIYVGASNTATVTVTSSTTTAVALTANPTSSTFGQQVALTAVLNPYSAGSNTTNGETVTFYSGATSLGTAALSSGVASLNVTSLAVGNDSLTAVYAGDSSFAGSTSNAVPFVVSGAAPTITFSVPNHAAGDAPFTVSATSNSTGALTYSVVSGPATIAGSTVTLTGSGTVVLQASQAAAGNFAAGTQNATFTVAGQSQTITFAAPASPVDYGVGPIALSASSSSGLAVRFSVLSGPATVSGSTLTITGAGTVVVAADQAGNTTYGPATEVTRSITVNKIASTIALSASPNPILVKNALGLTATVGSAVGTPTGTVTFMEGNTSLGMAPSTGGVASLSVSTLAVGTHSITATYGGDANFNASSSSNAVSVTVEDFTLTAPATTSQTITAGGTATFTFPVTLSGGTTLPTAVTFSTTGAPAGATVTFTPASLAAGSSPTSVAMAVTTPAHALLERPGAGLPVVALALLLLPFMGRKRLGKIAVVLVMLTGLGGAAMLTGCGGSSSSSSGGGGVTGPLTYTITVTATSGTLTHTSAVTLTVQ